jgi:hypothetical protein
LASEVFHLKRILAIIVTLLWNAEGWTAQIDIPLTLQETAGVERFQFPVTSGVPIPQGALTSTEKLQIMDTRGRFVPAQFSVANRWWNDGSIQWLHFDFSANVPAGGKANYFLREVAPIPEFPSPIGLIPRGAFFEVVTGPLRFVIGGASNQLFDQVWVDENWGYDFSDHTKILESGHFDLALTSNGRVYRTSNWTQNRIEIEEANALRAVIKISGTFATPASKEKSFDYVARMTVYGGKAYVKLAFQIVNRQGDPNGIRLDDLSLRFRLNLNHEKLRFSFGGTEGDHSGTFAMSPSASLYQESSDQYVVSGAAEGSGSAKSAKPLNLGWADLSDDQRGLAISERWFWQLFPKAYEVKNDSTISLQLFPSRAHPQNIALGMAKTHTFLLYFHGKRDFESGQLKNMLLGFQKPVYALAPAQWYCRNAQALGRLPESSEEAYRADFWPLVKKYDEWLVRSRDAVVANRDKAEIFGGQPLDEYGMLNFGDARWGTLGENGDHTAGRSWANLTYDFPHALYLHFFRTGDLRSLEVAEEALAHLMDVDIRHFALDSKLIGAPRPAPAVDHWVQTPVDGQSLPTWDSYQNEGLFDSFLLTGNRAALGAARLSVEHVMNYDGLDFSKESRSLGNVLSGLLKGYEVLGESRFLDRADWVVKSVHSWQDGNIGALKHQSARLAKSWSENFRNGYGPDPWSYGAAWEALSQYYDRTQKKEVPGYLKRSADWVFENPRFWDSAKKRYLERPELAITFAAGLAPLYEYTGDSMYWDLALEAFKSQVEQSGTVDRLDLFGHYFKGSQRFLWYLSKGFSGPRRREVSLIH